MVVGTEDNSKTLLIENTDVTYHSRHGAITESRHIFIKNGLNILKNNESISIFEMGFGTGLNAILAQEFSKKHNIKIHYHTIEKYPLLLEETNAIISSNAQFLDINAHKFKLIHACKWEVKNKIDQLFSITKYKADLTNFEFKNNDYNIIFFDAFGPKFQPNLWQPSLLKRFHGSLKKEGIFITYCAQGQFKRDLKSVGFDIESLPGPPGKREITRGIKR